MKELAMLRPGDRFILPGDDRVFEVLRVSFTGATVRPIRKKRVNYTTKRGQEVDYLATHDSFVIGANSIVKKIDENEMGALNPGEQGELFPGIEEEKDR